MRGRSTYWAPAALSWCPSGGCPADSGLISSSSAVYPDNNCLLTAENVIDWLFSVVTEGIFLRSFQEHLGEEGLVCSAVINYQVQL